MKTVKKLFYLASSLLGREQTSNVDKLKLDKIHLGENMGYTSRPYDCGQIFEGESNEIFFIFTEGVEVCLINGV